jgi:hypothetical protein
LCLENSIVCPADPLSAGLFLGNSGLGGGQSGDRHTVRRTTDVIEIYLVAKGYRARIASVLPADPIFSFSRVFRPPATPIFISPRSVWSIVWNGSLPMTSCSR